MKYAAAILPAFGAVAIILADSAFSEPHSQTNARTPSAEAAEATNGPGGAIVGRQALAEDAKFGTLSPANRKIAHALYRAQQVSAGAEGNAGLNIRLPWSLDRIAAAKEQSRGWGEVFRRMQAERVIDGPSLAQIIGQEWIREFHEEKDAGRAGGAAVSSSDVVVTYTNNRSSVVVTRGHPGYAAIRANTGMAAGNAAGRLNGGDGTRR